MQDEVTSSMPGNSAEKVAVLPSAHCIHSTAFVIWALFLTFPRCSQENPLQQARSKWSTFFVRAKTTFYLIFGFIFFIWMGHVPLMAMILGIQVSFCRGNAFANESPCAVYTT